jgi:tRNA threonylcarbamoyladenosine biosynthesis protein TsaB
MLILAIDTSSRNGSVALLRDRHVLDEISGHEETLYSTRLFRDLDVLQSRAQFQLGQIDVFAVVSGPGSFTGLRVGLTAVKAWAEVHGKPIAAVNGLEAIAAQAKALKGGGDGKSAVIAPFLDARRGQVFGSLYQRQSGNPPALKVLAEESVFSAEEFVALVKGTLCSGRPFFVSPTPEVISPGFIAEAFPGVHADNCVEIVSPVLAPVIGLLAFEQARRGELIDALRLDANYVRRSDAESAWKDTR